LEGLAEMAEPDNRRRSWCTQAAGGLILLALQSACGNSLTEPTPVRSPVVAAKPSPSPSPSPTPTPQPRVALITIDGLRADAVTAETTPNIWNLVARGAYTFRAQTIFPSNTLPSHTSMLTGVEPSVHGVTFDEYSQTFQFSTPTALSLVHAAGKRSVMIVGKDKFQQIVTTGSVDTFKVIKAGDADVVNEAITEVQATGFDLLFVHLPQVDQVGHYSGWMSPEYMAQVLSADEQVGRLVSFLPVGTTVIVTSDHGGAQKVHGTTAPTDLTIPWIVVGPRVTHKGAISRNVRTTDTAATILAVLGITAPNNCTGKTVSEIFDTP
jgi:predicted AlkP superfamily pyrophosphatase or phosphodiesterase